MGELTKEAAQYFVLAATVPNPDVTVQRLALGPNQWNQSPFWPHGANPLPDDGASESSFYNRSSGGDLSVYRFNSVAEAGSVLKLEVNRSLPYVSEQAEVSQQHQAWHGLKICPVSLAGGKFKLGEPVSVP